MEVRHVRSRMSGSGAARAFAARLLQGGARGLLRRYGSCAGDRGRGPREKSCLARPRDETGATAEKISADTLVVLLAVVDVAAKAARNPDYLLTTEDLADWEKKHHRLPDNCCVAMQSGWAQHVGNPAKFTGKDGSGVFHFPGVSPQAAEWLMNERNVVGLAVDTLSLDHGPSKDFKVHYAWLPSGRWGLENVANLDKVPPSGAMLVVGLAKVKDATGGPARLIALV